MRGMILAAGLGTRLRPLTDVRPKALVEIEGCSLLEITLDRLRRHGVDEIIVNVHHFADMVVEYLKANQDFGMRIEVSREDALLGTGGGLKKAAAFFLDDPDRLDEPFVLHNVDVLTTIEIGRMVEFHTENQALATLAVHERDSSRYLLFDENDQLSGWRSETENRTRRARPSRQARPLAFTGVHVISPRLLPMMAEEGAFSIIDTYLNLATRKRKILAFRADEYAWVDVGSVEKLKAASENLPG